VVEDLVVARLDEIVYTVTGTRRITVQWMYRIQDTTLAEPVKVAGAAARKRGAKQAENVSLLLLNASGRFLLLLGAEQRAHASLRPVCRARDLLAPLHTPQKILSCAAVLFSTNLFDAVLCAARSLTR
jgi:hypothetical protein